MGLLFLTTGATAQAATYYVSKAGNDAHNCAQARNDKTAKLTIPAGVACLAGGDTLIVKAGTYTNQQITNPPAGSEGRYTVIKADPSGARPIIDPDGINSQRGFYCDNGEACQYIELRGFEITTAYNSVKLYGSPESGYPHHLRFIDNIMHDTVHTNVLISTSDTGFEGGDHLFQGNEFYRTGVGNPGYAPGHNTIYNPGNRSIVENNKFHNLANGVGIWTSGKMIQNVIVRNNIFYDIGRSNTDTWQQGNGSSSAVHVSVPGDGHQIYNNLIYRSGDQASFAAIRVNPQWDPAGAKNIHIYNNTIYDLKNLRARAIWVVPSGGDTNFVKNNIAFHAGQGIVGGTQSNNFTSDPFFVNAAAGDFGLQETSPAIDAGAVLAQVSVDFEGKPRPAGAGYDLGVFEGAGSRSHPLAGTGTKSGLFPTCI